MFGRRPVPTVAWGNAPGTRANIGRLAEGHSHRPAAGNVSMAFGQKKPDNTVVLGRCPRLRWEQAFGQTLAGLPNAQLRRPLSSKLRIFGSKFWPKATFTVAWGNAPGTRANIGRLAEGHIHRPAAGNVSMAFGQKKPDNTVVLGRCPRLRWEQAFGQTLAGLPNAQLRRPLSSKLRIFGSKFWPKATFTVAWGNAPGTRANIGRLAEGHSHRPAAGNVSMAFGQRKPDDTVVLGRCPRLRWEQAFGQTLARLPNAQLRRLLSPVPCSYPCVSIRVRSATNREGSGLAIALPPASCRPPTSDLRPPPPLRPRLCYDSDSRRHRQVVGGWGLS